MQVSEFMNKKVKVVRPGTSIQIVIEMMAKNRIGSIIIQDEDDKIMGIVTERDVLSSIAEKQSTKEPVDTIMTKKVIAIEPETDLSEAIEIMIKYRIKKLVVTEEGTLIGIISTYDILKNLKEYSEDMMSRISEVFGEME